MRAQLLRTPRAAASGPLEPVELPSVQPGPGELLLNTTACAVCRTDLQLCEGDLVAQVLPIVPGHQAVGHVAAIGPGVPGWKIGDRAGVAWLGGACGECTHCSGGRENLCGDASFTGWHRPGGFASQIIVRADFALRLPGDFSDREAAPLLCGGIIGYRALKLSGIEPGGRLGLFGFGASALLALQTAVHWGCEVSVVTRSESARRLAREHGAAWTGDYDAPLPGAREAAITFAPVGSVIVAALRSLDRGATLVVNAIHLDEVPAFAYELLWGERRIQSVANFTRADAVEFLDLAAAIPLQTEITTYPLHAANDALADLAAGRVRGAAVLEI
jgi:propanol-preferring alcohol dehydrogenase